MFQRKLLSANRFAYSGLAYISQTTKNTKKNWNTQKDSIKIYFGMLNVETVWGHISKSVFYPNLEILGLYT